MKEVLYKIYYKYNEEDCYNQNLAIIQGKVLSGSVLDLINIYLISILVAVSLTICFFIKDINIAIMIYFAVIIISFVVTKLNKFLYLIYLKKFIYKYFNEITFSYSKEGTLSFFESYLIDDNEKEYLKKDYKYINKLFLNEDILYIFFNKIMFLPITLSDLEGKEKFLQFITKKTSLTIVKSD